MKLRKVAIGGTMAVALAVALTAAAWACTVTHSGSTWFCQSSSACPTPGGSLVQGSSAFQVVQAVAGATYTLNYDVSTGNCHTGPSLGTLTTDGTTGKGSAAITAPSAGSYTSCPGRNGTSQATNHKNFTVTT